MAGKILLRGFVVATALLLMAVMFQPVRAVVAEPAGSVEVAENPNPQTTLIGPPTVQMNSNPMILALPNNGNPIFAGSGFPVQLGAVLYDIDGDALNVTWDWGDGSAPAVNATGPAGSGLVVTNSHTWNVSSIPGLDETIPVVFYLVFTVEDGMGGSASVNVTVNVFGPPNAPPQLSIHIEPDYADPAEQVLIMANASDAEGEALTWTFRFLLNGTDAAPPMVHHTPTSAPNELIWNNITYSFGEVGVYTVTLNVTDSIPPYDVFPHNISADDWITIRTNSAPTASSITNLPDTFIDVSIGYVNVDFFIDVYDPDGDPVSAEWHFGDEVIRTNQTEEPGTATFVQRMNFTEEGIWDIKVNVSDGRPGHNISVERTVVVLSNNHAPSILVFWIHAVHGPPQSPVVFVNQSVQFEVLMTDPESDPLELTWDFGDGTPPEYDTVSSYVDGNVTGWANHTYLAPGNYTLTLSVTDNKLSHPNQTSEISVLMRVIVDDIPPVADAGDEQTVQAPSLVQFDGTGSYDDWDIANYTWTFTYNSTQIILWGPTPSFEYWSTGLYIVILNVTDWAGNYNTSSVKVKVVQEIPEFEFVVLPVLALLALFLCSGLRRNTSRR